MPHGTVSNLDVLHDCTHARSLPSCQALERKTQHIRLHAQQRDTLLACQEVQTQHSLLIASSELYGASRAYHDCISACSALIAARPHGSEIYVTCRSACGRHTYFMSTLLDRLILSCVALPWRRCRCNNTHVHAAAFSCFQRCKQTCPTAVSKALHLLQSA